jgi:hypothetical protein
MPEISLEPSREHLQPKDSTLLLAQRRAPPWKALMAFGVLSLAASCATPSSSEGTVPVEIVQGELVKLWGVSSQRTDGGVEVTGSVTRQRGPNGPFNEHLHAEAINPSGDILSAQDVPWNSIASLRTRHYATFRTTFGLSNGDAIARVRLKVVTGAVHFSD